MAVTQKYTLCQCVGFVGNRIVGGPYQFSVDVVEYALGAVGWRVIFYDRTDKTQKIGELSSDMGNPIISALSFNLVETGCGDFSMTLLEDPRTLAFDLDYHVGIEIYLYHDTNSWYAGYITSMPVFGSTKRPWTIKGAGYFNQLETCIFKQSYSNTEISDIVRAITDDYIEEKTDIIYADYRIQETSYTLKDVKFKYDSAKKALQQLAEIAQDFVVGVNENRELFFRGRSADPYPTAVLFVGKHLDGFDVKEDTDNLANRIIVRAGKIADSPKTPVRAIVEDGNSMLNYGIREKIVTADFIRDDDDAEQFGLWHLSNLKSPKKKARIGWVDVSQSKIPAYGRAKIITNEYYDPAETNEQVEGFGQDPVTWLADPSATRTCDTSVYKEGGASYKFDWTTQSTAYFRMYRVYPEAMDWTLFTYVKFWIKPHFSPGTFKFEFGEAAHAEQSIEFSATMLQWNEVTVDISSVSPASRNAVKYVRVGWEASEDYYDGTCWLDDLRGIWYVTEPVVFSLAIKKAKYSLGADGITCSLDLGELEPTLGEVVKKIYWKIAKQEMMQDQVISQI